MSDSLLQAVQDYVEANIGDFHQKRLDTVKSKRLNAVLQRKNPYLFKAKNTQKAGDLVESIMDAFISSQEETLFGNFLEEVAIFVANYVHDGYKPKTSELTGIDLVFDKDIYLFIVEIKSGPNWGNSSQKQKMYLNFRNAIQKLQPEHPDKIIVPVNGCMYGKNTTPYKIGKITQNKVTLDRVPYWFLCGQDFWYFISNNKDLYVDIIEPLGYKAKERNDTFSNEYDKLINRFTDEFISKYCKDDYSIDWNALTQYVSESPTDDILSEMDNQ